MSSIKDSVYRWNLKFPIDRWWRQKHRVPYGSQEHRNSSFIDQLFEYIEDQEFAKLQKPTPEDEAYVPNTGNFLIKRKMDQRELEKIYDEIDLDNIRE